MPLKSRNRLILAAVVAVVLLVCLILYLRLALPPFASGRVAPIDDRSYFAAVDNLIRSANVSVDVILYQPRFYFRYPNTSSNRLIADLIEASRRGVKVRALIEQANWNIDNSEKNRDVFNILNSNGVEVYFDSPVRTTHSKLVLIDRRYAVIGSSNWSYYSLEKNNEANVVVDSKKLASLLTDYFENLVREGTKAYLVDFKMVKPREALDVEEGYFLISDITDSCKVAQGDVLVYFDDVAVRFDESTAGEAIALEPDFFETAVGESIRVIARMDKRGSKRSLLGIDIEKRSTLKQMLEKVEMEIAAMRQSQADDFDLDWVDSPRIVPATNENYAKQISRLIERSRERIWIAMLDARYYDRLPRHATRKSEGRKLPSLTNQFAAELASAVARGANVRIVCDTGWGEESQESEVAFLKKLDAAGADVFEDSPNVTTHCKLAIFDSSFVVIGSTNWSYFAVEENNETSVVIECPRLNAHYAQYIMALGARKMRFAESFRP